MKKLIILCGFLLGESLCAMDLELPKKIIRDNKRKADRAESLMPTEAQLKKVRLEDEDRLRKFEDAVVNSSEKSYRARLAVVGAATGSSTTAIDVYHAFHAASIAHMKVVEAGSVDRIRDRSISFEFFPVN